MKTLQISSALALALAAAACGESRTAASENRQAGAPVASVRAGQAYSATGAITAIAGDRVTISHGPVQGLGWPAMTMTFRAGSPNMLQGLQAGDRVSFEFMAADGGYVLTSLTRAQ
jgi:Cu/Ag efflux protein CusF